MIITMNTAMPIIMIMTISMIEGGSDLFSQSRNFTEPLSENDR